MLNAEDLVVLAYIKITMKARDIFLMVGINWIRDLKWSYLLGFLYCAVSVSMGFGSCPAMGDVGRKEVYQTEVSPLAKVISEYKGIPRNGVAISVKSVDGGPVLFSYRASEAQMPASVQKIFTSVTALKVLGPDYRFQTEIFADNQPYEEGNVGRIYVRGHGDPMLNSELMWKLAQEIADLGVKQVKEVVVDDSLFVAPLGVTGTEPYQAGVSATSFNFNCIAVTFAPTGTVRLIPNTGYRVLRDNGDRRGGEPMLELQSNPQVKGGEDNSHSYREAGVIRVAGVVPNKTQTIFLTVDSPALHFGFGLREALLNSGIKVSGGVVIDEVSNRATKLHSYYSPELAEILKSLNRYSSNFSANQVLYALGGDDGNRNSEEDLDSNRDEAVLYRREKGITKVMKVIEQSGASLTGIAIYDGSGLDKRNRATADALTSVLVAAYSDMTISPYLFSSLSRYGKSGTLKKRHLKLSSKALKKANNRFVSEGVVYGKTGTLDQVSSLAGYAPTRNGKTVAFAIMIEGAASKEKATEFEDTIVSSILAEL